MYLNIYMEFFSEGEWNCDKTVATAGILGKERLCYRARFPCILMTIHERDIDKLCVLARLALDQDERKLAREDLSRIIAMIDSLAAVPTDSIEPLAHPLDATQRLRVDEVTEQVDRDAFQRIAPVVRDGLYLVPRVVD
jgi:aspartyl-tRNA(Asn)/glutamyl-tRNA(Gln) amidotransferase subunit C